MCFCFYFSFPVSLILLINFLIYHAERWGNPPSHICSPGGFSLASLSTHCVVTSYLQVPSTRLVDTWYSYCNFHFQLVFLCHSSGWGLLPPVWFSNKSVLPETKIAWTTSQKSALSASVYLTWLLETLFPKLNHETAPSPCQSHLFSLKLFPGNPCLWMDQDKWSGRDRKSVFCCPHKGPGGKAWLFRAPLALIMDWCHHKFLACSHN